MSLLIALSGCAEANVSEVPLPPVKPTSLGAVASTAGGLCGDPRLKGERIGRLTGKIAACGVQDAIRLTHVSGIALRAPARVNCDTARTFADWLTGPANASARRSLGSPIRNVRVVASYACRSRNNRPGARLSEHAFGRAIDVGGVTLANGREISVLENWGKGSAGAWLREIWRAACGPFKTVLGPDGDRFHKDHFHFDVAQRRSTFCR
ncbi:MAG: extensin family protein [Pseudomonadota bacterium]